MTNARRDGFYFVVLGCAIFLLFGVVLEVVASHPISDFRFVYNGARCILRGLDPYSPAEFQRVMVSDGADLSGPDRNHYLEMSHHMYLPTSMIVAPLALLPWVPALTIWTILIAGTFMLASLLMWDAAGGDSPLFAGSLLLLMLGSSQSLLIIGNADGLVVSLTVIAAWCFINERFPWAGAVCLALALLLKPHDAGLVWLYFLLAGGTYRKHAIRTLEITAALGVVTVVWVSLVAPHWFSELRSNLAYLALPGHLNDPGPASMAGHGIAMVIDLQSVLSVFWDKPAFYNPVSFLISGVLFVAWIRTILKSKANAGGAWLALAVASALTMLPVYHRLSDAKLLLLTLPAGAALLARAGRVGRIAALLNTLGFFLTGAVQWVILLWLLQIASKRHLIWGWPLTDAQVMPVPFVLLAISLFYLWISESKARSLIDSPETLQSAKTG
ncbi:MAG TPA: hypothetical protein VKR52_06410 [Terracidiphilus sp.]|nr:hypothetical protein [Terracidiphilus sp.]